ncbi:MAG: flagellar protein FlaG [Gallionellaceae bacterium]|nr:MAG: flagellar protein FlaG [Gallionellaceae bacterium]
MSISSVTLRPVASAQSDGTRVNVQEPPPASSVVQSQKTVPAEAAVQPPSPEHVAQAVKEVNYAFTQKGQNLYASIERDRATGIDVVKVLDKNTREVISQFPSKAIVAMAEALSQSQEGKGQLIHVSA